MILKLPNMLASILFVFATVCTAVFGYNEVFPDPQVTKLHEEFKVHEATPAHGIEKIQTVQIEMQIVQGIILDDLGEIEEDVKMMRNEQHRFLTEISRRIQ